jgi:hypothetical protein
MKYWKRTSLIFFLSKSVELQPYTLPLDQDFTKSFMDKIGFVRANQFLSATPTPLTKPDIRILVGFKKDAKDLRTTEADARPQGLELLLAKTKKGKEFEYYAKGDKTTAGTIAQFHYDNFTKELLAEGGSHDQEMSQSDIEKLYNLVCFNIIGKQIDEDKKFAPERSWGKLKTALNVWLLPMLGNDRLQAYKVILHDLLKEGSVLKPIIGEALAIYRPIRDQEVNKKSERSKRTEVIEIPRASLFFTDNYEEMKVKKSVMEPFYIAKDVVENEKSFIKLLEEKGNAVEWWYKNGDSGSEYFSISYYNPDENKEKLFYPDWIIKTKNKTWIVDTKAGFTAESNDTKYKAEALQEWLKGKKGFAGGIVVNDANGWKINANKEYSYTPAMKGWDNFLL